MARIRFRDVRHAYPPPKGQEPVYALNEINQVWEDGGAYALLGPSGCGKSSIVRAGLLPAVRRGALPESDQWYVTTMLPGPHPFEELESARARGAEIYAEVKGFGSTDDAFHITAPKEDGTGPARAFREGVTPAVARATLQVASAVGFPCPETHLAEDDSSVRRRELPMVCPKPGSRGPTANC